jgi:hypothetical protein
MYNYRQKDIQVRLRKPVKPEPGAGTVSLAKIIESEK